MKKVIAEMSFLKAWGLFHVNINRMTHKTEGLGMCSKLTLSYIYVATHLGGETESAQP